MFFKPEFIDFFIELAANNQKEWFDANRSHYENYVKIPFYNFVEHLIIELKKKDARYADLEAKECIFRINRDIRFSKDKTPYKLYVSALIAPGGKKSKSIDGIYIELGPEQLSVYAGVYEADKDDISFIREGIIQELNRFQQLYQATDFVTTFGTILGEKNKILPKEFQAEAIQEPLIFNKQWYFCRTFEPETILHKELDLLLINCLEVAQPLNQFFQDQLKK